MEMVCGFFFVALGFFLNIHSSFCDVLFQLEKKQRKSWGLKLRQMKLDVQVVLC